MDTVKNKDFSPIQQKVTQPLGTNISKLDMALSDLHEINSSFVESPGRDKKKKKRSKSKTKKEESPDREKEKKKKKRKTKTSDENESLVMNREKSPDQKESILESDKDESDS